jgi:hypothetical protein
VAKTLQPVISGPHLAAGAAVRQPQYALLALLPANRSSPRPRPVLSRNGSVERIADGLALDVREELRQGQRIFSWFDPND